MLTESNDKKNKYIHVPKTTQKTETISAKLLYYSPPPKQILIFISGYLKITKMRLFS